MKDFDPSLLPVETAELSLAQVEAAATEACAEADIVNSAVCALEDSAGFVQNDHAEFRISTEDFYANSDQACSYDRQPIGRVVFVGFSTPVATRLGSYSPKMKVAEYLYGIEGALNVSDDWLTDEQVEVILDGLAAIDEAKVRLLNNLQEYHDQLDDDPDL